jgi:succinyl-CoA synthetase beta subunit
MDIEQGRENGTIFTEEISPSPDFSLSDPEYSIQPGSYGNALKNMQKFLNGIYETFTGCDAQLLEINPVLKQRRKDTGC